MTFARGRQDGIRPHNGGLKPGRPVVTHLGGGGRGAAITKGHLLRVALYALMKPMEDDRFDFRGYRQW